MQQTDRLSIRQGKRLARYAFYVLLVLVQIEIALRFVGWGLKELQSLRNLGQPARLSVLVLGESTSADNAAPEGKSWPRILEQLLNLHGIDAKVINEAESSTTTNVLLQRLPGLLKKHRPQIVIAMMGINDRPGLHLARAGIVGTSAFSDLRILKIARALANLDEIEKTFIDSRPLQSRLSLDKSSYDSLVRRIREGHIDDVEREIADFLKDKTDVERSAFRTSLGFSLLPPWGRPVQEMGMSLRFFSAAMKDSVTVSQLPEVTALLSHLSNQSCRWMVDEFRRQDENPGPVAISRMLECFQNDPPTQETVYKAYAGNYEFDADSKTPPTTENYRSAYAMVHASGACLIAMQYPTLDVSEVIGRFERSHLANREHSKLYFVSNRENFAKAFETMNYEDLFIDRFGPTFGHTNVRGHELIATNVADVVKELAGNKSCE